MSKRLNLRVGVATSSVSSFGPPYAKRTRIVGGDAPGCWGPIGGPFRTTCRTMRGGVDRRNRARSEPSHST